MVTIRNLGRIGGGQPDPRNKNRIAWFFYGVRTQGMNEAWQLTFCPGKRSFRVKNIEIPALSRGPLPVRPENIDASGKTITDILKAQLTPEEVARCITLSLLGKPP